MQIRLVIRVVSAILLVCGLAMLTAVPVSLLRGDAHSVMWGLLGSAAITCLVGAVGAWRGPKATRIRVREGFGIVTFSWLAATAFGALPFVWVGGMSYVDAVFETMSGFTTTGASVLTEKGPDGVFALPWGLLYWRSLTHWLGGMGIVVLSLAILPLLGVGAMQLYRSEAPGPTSDQVTPRVAHTARRLWAVYLLLSVAETLLLWPKMDLLEAWCHTCGTMATGGFSTRGASVGAFNSPYVDWVITVFMMLAGANFLLHYKALLGRPQAYLKDEEFRFYSYVMGGSIVAVMLVLLLGRIQASVWEALRFSAFNVVSIMTTTGFATADFDLWPVFARALLVLLMFVGGCGGSTGGGIKCSRITALLKHAAAQVKRTLYPRSMVNIRLNDRPVPHAIMSRMLGFFFIYIGLFILIGMLLCVIEPGLGGPVDGVEYNRIETAFTAAVATLSNIGPGLGKIGPTQHYAWMAPWSKLLLVLSMLLGRLEVFTVVVLFHPRFWRR
jgi:trk system potassium uptake protein TrkH